MPPAFVSICMFGDIQDMAPASVATLSPSVSSRIAMGRFPPSMVYCIEFLLRIFVIF